MFDKQRFLADVLSAAGSKSAMARALGLPPARIFEVFKDERKLSIEEGMLLAERFGIEPFVSFSAEALTCVLEVVLRDLPKKLDRPALQMIAEEIEYGLTLLNSAHTKTPTPETLDLVARVLADRRRGRPS